VIYVFVGFDWDCSELLFSQTKKPKSVMLWH